MLGIDQAVIGRVRLVKHGKARRIRLPRKSSAIDDDAAHRSAVTAEELRQRVHHDIGAIFDRPEQDRRGDRIVDNERNAMPVSDARERFDIANVPGRVADALTEHRLGIAVDQSLNSFRTVGLGKADADPLAWENVRKQRVGCAVELRHGHDVAAECGDVEQRHS